MNLMMRITLRIAALLRNFLFIGKLMSFSWILFSYNIKPKELVIEVGLLSNARK
jgi:hypothetical protein